MSEVWNENPAVMMSSKPRHQAAKDELGGTVFQKGLTADALERFVYIVGTPRSGTTVITRSFYLSDRVFACPNPTRFTSRVWRYRNKVSRRLLIEIFKMPKFYHERRALRTFDRAERLREERRIREAFDSKHLGRMYQLYPFIYSHDPGCKRSVQDAVCWADKGNDVYGLFEIARSLPRAKFIFIIRDPRATVASMKSQTVVSQGVQGSRQANVAALLTSCMYWRNMMQSFLRLARRHPGRAVFLRYEDFVEDSTESINRALEFATGERMPVEALQSGLSQFQHKQKHDRDPLGRKEPAHGVTRGIDRRPLDRWRRMLDYDEIQFVTALTWRTARKLGYDIELPTRRFAALQAIFRIKGWRTRLVLIVKLAYLEMVEWIVWRRTRSTRSPIS